MWNDFYIYRGPSFRHDYLEAANLRGIFPEACTLGLSATVNQKVFDDIKGILHWKPRVIALLPDRPNLFLEVVHKTTYSIPNDLQWIVDGLAAEGDKFPKTLIFAQTTGLVNDIHAFLKIGLQNKVYRNEVASHANRLVSKYHGTVSSKLQTWTFENMTKSDAPLRALATTVAWGMGINVKDVRYVIVYGKCANMLTFWQQMGRGGRDGQPAKAIWYPKSTAGDDHKLFEEIKTEKNTCVRKLILTHFLLPSMDEMCLNYLDEREPCTGGCDMCTCPFCKCCTHCAGKCPCGNSQ